MSYSIGAVAEKVGLPASTLRYYDREGLLPTLDRSPSGLRVFSDNDLEGLRMIECLKRSGLSIKDIKRFMDWCEEGDSTLSDRRQMFYERRDAVKAEMAELQNTLDLIDYKCWFYDTAVAAGTSRAPMEMALEDMPARIREIKARM